MIKWKKGNVRPTRMFPLDFREFVASRFFENVRGVDQDVLEGFTCLDHNGLILRAHPSYKSKREWFDHCLVKWEKKKKYTVFTK